MIKSVLQFTRRLILVPAILLLLSLAACSAQAAATPIPPVTPRPGPAWTPQQAIEKIEALPLSAGELSWNAEFDRYQGRWQLTLVYGIRKLYPPRDERRTLLWYVYEDSGKVEGPFK